ncbi:MAG: hypothetical protein F6K48_03010 [Okeania sp. SIO3H1]|nr:hypothetical protein [Okeania sp. SIO3H1]
MADIITTVEAKQFEDTPGSQGLVPRTNFILDSLLEENFTSFNLSISDRARRNGLRLDLLIGYSTPGDTTLTSPYQLLVASGKTLEEASNFIESFKNVNPGFFYSGTNFRFVKTLAPGINPYFAWVVYNEDPEGVQNWKVGGGSGGGSSGGGASVPISAQELEAGSTVIDGLVTDIARSVFWEVAIQDDAGNVQTLIIEAQHNGTSNADATEADFTIYGVPETGTVAVFMTVELSGAGAAQEMRLVANVTSGTWALSGWRRAVPVLIP